MLCARHGKFLYEARPDLFPQGFLTDVERDIWGLYFEEENARYERVKNRR